MGLLLAIAAALYLASKGQQSQAKGSLASGEKPEVSVSAMPLFGNPKSSAPHNNVIVMRETGGLGTWQDWQNGKFIPQPTGSRQDVYAPPGAISDSAENQAANLAAIQGQGPQVINPNDPSKSKPVTTGAGSTPTSPSGGGGTSGSVGVSRFSGGGGGGGFSCPIEGTEILTLGGKAFSCTMLPEYDWITIRTANGKELTASESHPVYTRRGLLELSALNADDYVVTDEGEYRVLEIVQEKKCAKKMRISLNDGHLYWANGILSHNVKAIGY